MDPHDYWLAAIPAGVTGLFGYLAARLQFRQKPIDSADTVANGFSKLVADLRVENDRHLASIKVLRADAHRMNNQLTKLHAFARAVFKHIAVLEGQIVTLGGEPTPRPSLPDVI